jgi:hypothetical protein
LFGKIITIEIQRPFGDFELLCAACIAGVSSLRRREELMFILFTNLIAVPICQMPEWRKMFLAGERE